MTPAADRARWLLAGAALLALAYLVLLHWWWTAPMLAMGDEIAKLRDEHLALRMEIAQRPALEAELARDKAMVFMAGPRQVGKTTLVRQALDHCAARLRGTCADGESLRAA